MAETTVSKIVRLETQMKNVEQKVDELKLDIHGISLKLDSITRLNDKVDQLEQEILEVKKRQNIKQWLFPTMSAAVSGLIVYLIIEYLKTR